MYLNLALRTSTWALYAQHEANLGHFGTILEPSWDHFEATWGSSVACFFVLRFSALRALILDSGVLLLCLAACCRDTGAHAKNTVKYNVFGRICSLRLQGWAAGSTRKTKRTELRKTSLFHYQSDMFQAFLKHFLSSRCPTEGDGHQSGQLGANLAQLRTNLGPTWGQVGANFGQLRPTWTNFGPDAAATWPTSAQLGPTWGQLGPQGPSGGLQKAFSDPPRDDFPPSGGRFSHHCPHSWGHAQNHPVHKACLIRRPAPLDVLV